VVSEAQTEPWLLSKCLIPGSDFSVILLAELFPELIKSIETQLKILSELETKTTISPV